MQKAIIRCKILAVPNQMNLGTYQKYWSDCGEKLYTYSPDLVDRIKVDQDTFIFLTTIGLPVDAAPFLNFSEIKENKLQTPKQIFGIELEGLDHYLVFGSTGSGDPICIDTMKQDEIVYLNHDNYFERIFINTTIYQFALCFTFYPYFTLSINNISKGQHSMKRLSDEEFYELKKNFLKIDKSSLNNNSFWASILEGLLWERDKE